MGASRRVGIGLLASALFVFGIALAPNAGATADVDVIRYAGNDRYGTAQDIATDPAFDGATTAIVATGEKFPDALAASSIAGVNAPAPILLTQSNVYRDETSDALADLGVDDVIIVGGTAAVSSSVEDAIEGEGYTVSRLAGTDRYGTAADIASEVGTAPDVDGLATAFVAAADATATGDDNFVDALAGGVATYAGGFPLVLVTAGGVPAVTESALEDLGVEQVVILGGTVRVPAAVEEDLEDITGNDAIRVAGATRFETAIAVAEWEEAELGFTPDAVVAATGFKFPDALAGGPLGGEHEAPIVLTGSCPEATTNYLEENSATIDTIYITGGTAVIDQATEDCLEAAAEGDEAAAATAAPEVLTVQHVSTTPADAAAAAACAPIAVGDLIDIVSFNFSEDIDAVLLPTGFIINPPDTGSDNPPTHPPGAGGDGSLASCSAAKNTGDPTKINAVFVSDDPGAMFDVADGTSGSVLAAAVDDIDGKTNPEGAASFDAPGSPTAPGTEFPGETWGPDLRTLGNCRDNPSDPTPPSNDEVLVDFLYGEGVDDGTTAVVPTSFFLVLGSGIKIVGSTSTGASGAAPAGAELGDATVTMMFDTVFPGGPTDPDGVVGAPSFTPAEVCAQLKRGYNLIGAVTDDEGNVNPQQAGEFASPTNTPDLAGLTIDPATQSATYTLSEAVSDGTILPGLFNLYDIFGGEVFGSAFTRPTPTTVRITGFPAGAVNNSIAGGSIDEGAVKAFSDGQFNRVDSFGLPSMFGPGGSVAPILTDVNVEVRNDVFNNPVGHNVIFVFDKRIDDGPKDFWVYVANGDGVVLAGCVELNAAASNTTMVCPTTNNTLADTAAQNAVLGAIERGAVFTANTTTLPAIDNYEDSLAI